MEIKSTQTGLPRKAASFSLGHPSKQNIVKNAPGQISQFGSIDWSKKKPGKASTEGSPC